MWEYWFEGFVIFMLLGISGRIFLMARHLERFHDSFLHFEDKIFNPEDEEDPDNRRAVAEWDNKL